MKIKLIIALLCFCFSSCQKPYKTEFLQVVRSHKEITVETVQALVMAIDERIAEPQILAEEKYQLEVLKERLMYMSSSSALIEKYLLESVDKETLNQLIKNIWE
jgi:CRISPR/Cas system endoribonuclease Cas6 (RAMP superfamily)